MITSIACGLAGGTCAQHSGLALGAGAGQGSLVPTIRSRPSNTPAAYYYADRDDWITRKAEKAGRLLASSKCGVKSTFASKCVLMR